MSKNIILASNYSKDSGTHSFDVKQGSILVGNNQPIGSTTIEQVIKGVDYPNVQAALNDMPALFILPIGSVHISDDGISPAGAPQTDDYIFSGVLNNGQPVGTPYNFNFYGFPVKVNVGDNSEEVANKVKKELDKAVANNFVFDSVVFGATLDTIQVRYNDFQEHNIPPYVEHGIKITPVISSPAKSGYGTWLKLGTQKTVLDGGSVAGGSIVLHYFRRDS